MRYKAISLRAPGSAFGSYGNSPKSNPVLHTMDEQKSALLHWRFGSVKDEKS